MTVPKNKEDRVRRFALALLGVSMGVAVVTTIVGGIDNPYDIVTGRVRLLCLPGDRHLDPRTVNRALALGRRRARR